MMREPHALGTTSNGNSGSIAIGQTELCRLHAKTGLRRRKAGEKDHRQIADRQGLMIASGINVRG